MTRFNRYLAFAAAALAAIASQGVFAAGNITFLPTGQAPCSSFSGMSVDPSSGDVSVTCKTVVAGQLGTVSLSATKYTGAKATSATPANVNIMVQRVGGATGALDGHLAVTSGCNLGYSDVSFIAGDSATKTVALTSSTTGISVCTVTLTSANGLGSPAVATVDVTDASAPPPVIAGCPTTPANVVMGTVLTSGLAGRVVDKARTDGLPPTIYSYPLPKNPSGGFYTTRDPDTPPSLTVNLSISKCPGDYASATTDPTEVFRYSFMPAVGFYPCVTTGSAEGTTLNWSQTLGTSTCMTDMTVQYYANIRITDDKGNYTCPLASATGPGCPLRFWWN